MSAWNGNGNYSWTSTYNHLSTTATFFVLVVGRSCFNLSTTATCPQRQQPLKDVPTVKITFSQRPVKQQLANGVHKTPFFYWTWLRNLFHTARRWSLYLFGFSLIDIFWFCYVFTCHTVDLFFFKIKRLNRKKISMLYFTPTETSP